MVCFHFLRSVLQDDYKLQHSAYFWRNKSCISIWFRSYVCLTYETHLADVIYHRAPFFVSGQNSWTGGSPLWQWPPSPQWGYGCGFRRLNLKSLKNLNLSLFFKLRNSFVFQSSTWFLKISFFKKKKKQNCWEKMGKALLNMGIFSQSWWGVTEQDIPL